MVKMIQEKSQKSQKVAIKYCCEKCDYNTCKIYDWNKHLTTAKHKMITNGTNDTQKSSKSRHLCECGKSYKHHSGLSRHKMHAHTKILSLKRAYQIRNHKVTTSWLII